MGDIAEMMLDGILDCNGEYTGLDLGYPFEYYNQQKTSQYLNKTVMLCKQFGCRNLDAACKKILSYGLPLGKNTVSQISKHICSGSDRTEWNKFKKWLKTSNN